VLLEKWEDLIVQRNNLTLLQWAPSGTWDDLTIKDSSTRLKAIMGLNHMSSRQINLRSVLFFAAFLTTKQKVKYKSWKECPFCVYYLQ